MENNIWQREVDAMAYAPEYLLNKYYSSVLEKDQQCNLYPFLITPAF